MNRNEEQKMKLLYGELQKRLAIFIHSLFFHIFFVFMLFIGQWYIDILLLFSTIENRTFDLFAPDRLNFTVKLMRLTFQLRVTRLYWTLIATLCYWVRKKITKYKIHKKRMLARSAIKIWPYKQHTNKLMENLQKHNKPSVKYKLKFENAICGVFAWSRSNDDCNKTKNKNLFLFLCIIFVFCAFDKNICNFLLDFRFLLFSLFIKNR